MTKRGAADLPASEPCTIVKPQSVQNLPTSVPNMTDNNDDLHGLWTSGKGKCRIGKDPVIARLSYMEDLEGGQRLHGWLDPVGGETSLWQGSLAILDKGKGPWYGPSFGPAPEVVGDIRVRLKPGDTPSMETQIRMAEDEGVGDWEAPTSFTKEEGAKVAPMDKPNFDKILPMKQNEPGEEEKEESVSKKKRDCSTAA